jgi:hypothetical protein
MKLDKVFKTINVLMSVRDVVKDTSDTAPTLTSAAETATSTGSIEARLTNVLVAALKEAFDRDHARLELERAHVEEQRRHAEQAMQIELRRHAADRELGRLRLLSGTALVGWIVSVTLLVARIGQMTTAATVILAAGSLVLLGALGAAFHAQERINVLFSSSDGLLKTGLVATATVWLLLVGLAMSAISLLA